MNPRRIAATLLEADDLLPDQEPIQAEPTVDPKDYISNLGPRHISGIPIRGYYRDLERKLENKRLRNVDDGERGYKVDHNTWLIIRDFDRHILLRFYDTDIIEVAPDDTMTVRNGGFETVTTRKRLADWLPGGWRLYQLKGNWYWWNYTETDSAIADQGFKTVQPFTDGDQVTADGTLIPLKQATYVKVRKPRGQA